MRSTTYGNELFRVRETSTGLYVTHYREIGRNSLGVVHAVPAFVFEKPNSPYVCSVDLPATEFYTRADIDCMIESGISLAPANTL